MTPKSILVPVDFSPYGEHALDYACGLAEKLGATLHLVNAIGAGTPELNVVFTDKVLETFRAKSMAELEKIAKDRASIAKFGHLIVQAGDPRDAILQAAEKLNPDLIIMGSHGRRGFSRAVLGSVAENVVRRAPCPVLVVRAPKEHKEHS